MGCWFCDSMQQWTGVGILMAQLLLPDHWSIRAKHGKKACVYEEFCGRKKVSFERTKYTKLRNLWASQLGSIRGNMPKWRVPRKCGKRWKYQFLCKWWLCSSWSKPVRMQEKNVIASAYFRTTCCVLLGTRVTEIAHSTTSVNISFSFLVEFNLHFLAIWLTLVCKNAFKENESCLLIKPHCSQPPTFQVRTLTRLYHIRFRIQQIQGATYLRRKNGSNCYLHSYRRNE
jgi:hypothetical protein